MWTTASRAPLCNPFFSRLPDFREAGLFPSPGGNGKRREEPAPRRPGRPRIREFSMELMDTAGTLLILVLALLVVRAVNRGGGRIGG